MIKRRQIQTLALLGGAACQTNLGTVDQAVVATTAPYRVDSTVSIVPDLGVRGSVPSAPDTATDPWSIHEATFSNGRDSNSPGAASLALWSPLAAGVDFWQFESSPMFTTDLAAAVAAAAPTLGHLTDLSWLASVLNSFPLPIHVDNPPPSDSFYGWAPVQARWLRNQFVATSPTGAMTRQVYADPAFAGEIRERGARLYCAARRAQFVQAEQAMSRSMGRQAALELSILGHTIEIGVVEPTFTLDGAQSFINPTSADGAQAFELPMLLGAQLTPIAGVGLPGFGELRHPVVLISGDSEVASAVAPARLHTGDRIVCGPFEGGCRTSPTFSTVSPKDYLTVTHADAALGRSAALNVVVPDTPIFTLGVFTLYLHGSGTVTIGSGGAAAPANDRLLAGIPAGWPTPARTGGLTTSTWSPMYFYDEEPWSPVFDVDAPLTGTPTFALPAAGGGAMFDASDPMVMRALADDDHHVATTTSIDLGVGGTGELGFNLGIAHFTVNGGATVTLAFGQQTSIRDGMLDLMGNGSGYPISALTVTPSTSTTVTATFLVTLRIQIPLVLDSIDETLTIATATTGNTWGATPWPQINRALIATGSQYGDPTFQPWAVSHLPASATPPPFTAYPTFDSFDQDVNACLADTTEYPPVPPGCPPTATGTTPHGNICVFTGSRIPDTFVGNGVPGAWSGACADIPSHVDAILPGATADQKACYVAVLSELCKPTSSEQDWHGQHGVSRIIDMVNPNIPLDTLADQCTLAFAPATAVHTFNRIFEFGACDDAARMLEPADVITTPPTPVGTPSPVTPGTCR